MSGLTRTAGNELVNQIQDYYGVSPLTFFFRISNDRRKLIGTYCKPQAMQQTDREAFQNNLFTESVIISPLRLLPGIFA